MAYYIDNTWDERCPVLQIDFERTVGKQIGTESVVRRCAISELLNYQAVGVSADHKFLVFQDISDVTKIKKFIKSLKEMWNDLASQAHYERDYTLKVYGRLMGRGKNGGRSGPILIAYGVREDVYKTEEEITVLSYQKAVVASKRALPF